MITKHTVRLALIPLGLSIASFASSVYGASVDDLDLRVLYEEGEPIGYQIYSRGTAEEGFPEAEGDLVIPAEHPYGDEGETLPIIEIDQLVFYLFDKLTSVTIPGSIKTIGTDVFHGCVALESATLLEGVPYLGYAMFASNFALATISLPQSLNRIDGNALAECVSLTSITIPAGVTDIGDYAFWNASALESIYFEGPTPTFGISVFDGIAADATFYVLEEHLASYEALNLGYTLATDWSGDGGGSGSDDDNFYAVSGSYDAENDQFIIVSKGEDSVWNMEVQHTDDLTSGEWTTLSSLSYLEASNEAENTVTRTISSVDATETPSRYYRLHSELSAE